jgi:predicted nucleic acid-binding protein
MKIRFADTFYFLALLNPADRANADARRWASDLSGSLLTTDWVIVEVADALAGPRQRGHFIKLWNAIRDHPAIEIVPAARPLLMSAIDLYEQRPDKAWSLTDCLSFVVMRERGVVEALTGDHHFEQAGFIALMRSP